MTKIFGPRGLSATVRDVAQKNSWAASGLAIVGAGICASVVWGCSYTQFYYEGPGSPSDRASGVVPDGSLGVCRIPSSKRPPIVNEKLWEDSRPCSAQTPDRFIRIGYGPGLAGAVTDADADKNMERLLNVLREGQKEDVGNNQVVSTLRNLHDYGLRDPELRDRVSRETARSSVCDYTYLLNTMSRERGKLAQGDRCAAQAFDGKARTEVCLFDTARDEVVWLTSSWSCATHSGAIGEHTSCFQLCAYDDYCAKQVSCSAPDIDLLLCAMGVCIPEPRAGIR